MKENERNKDYFLRRNNLPLVEQNAPNSPNEGNAPSDGSALIDIKAKHKKPIYIEKGDYTFADDEDSLFIRTAKP